MRYEPEFKAFCISDKVVKEFKTAPVIKLNPIDYECFGRGEPAAGTPVIGFLLGRDTDCYSAGLPYVQSMVGADFDIRFLTYEHCEEQLKACQGLLLPGGMFASPEAYYTDPRDDIEFPTLRSKAYELCIRKALEMQIPILGICAGAQMIAGHFGLKLYRSFDYIETPIAHKTDVHEAHRLNIFPNTPLQRMFGPANLFFVNSRHRELVAPVKIQRELLAEKLHINPAEVALPLEIYAEASDGTPEAWGSAAKKIFCVQWHPEDMVVNGSLGMLKVFHWLREQI